MKKNGNIILYLMVVTLVVFYLPKIISGLVNSEGDTPTSLAEDAGMGKDAYFALREVASVQLGYVLISYEMDEESGRCRKRFTNAACPTGEGEPQKLIADQKKQQEVLHKQILILGPVADEDGSGSISDEEGARFRDLFEFGHLATECFGSENPEISLLARAVGLDSLATSEKLQDYRNLRAKL